MAFFSRLTEIVSCNVKTLLKEADDPLVAIRDIIGEIEEGISGARRSLKTASDNADRLTREMDKQVGQIALWHAKAIESLRKQDEEQARYALQREMEITDLTNALKQQQEASQRTLEQIRTTLKGLEAQLATARREDQELNRPLSAIETHSGPIETSSINVSAGIKAVDPIDVKRAAEIELSLERMKRQLQEDATSK